jgi:hypothetical protein
MADERKQETADTLAAEEARQCEEDEARAQV